MPNHTDLIVSLRSGGLDSLFNGVLHSVELMIASDDFREVGTGLAEYREVA